MIRLIQFLSRLLGSDAAPAAPARVSGDDSLREKIAKWDAQAREFDALGCPGLARDFRESARAHERQLALRHVGRKAA